VIEFRNSSKGGTDISFQAKPVGKTTEEEVELAYTLVATCNLLSNEKFREHIDPFIRNELIKMHQEESGAKHFGRVM
jgi:hypothetical protein